MSGSEVAVGALRSVAEFDACVGMQIAVWGYADGDVIPRRMFLVASHIGGQVFGARVRGELVGFAMALPGLRQDGTAYLHSHMVAVLPEFQNLGLGRRLKLVQRDEALSRGIGLMEWTFDPMQTKNAYFNLQRLGAVCSRYQPDFYGESSSPLQGGLPTDRLVAEWWMGSERVRGALTGRSEERRAERRVRFADAGLGAAEVQCRLREGLMDGLAAGLQVIGFDRGENTYLMGREDKEQDED